MTQRTKTDAMRDLYAVENQIASKEKTARNSVNLTTVKICDATLPSLRQRAAALRAEIETLPEPAPRLFEHTAGNFPCLTRTAPFSEAELAAFPEIPAFLRRAEYSCAEPRIPAPSNAEIEW